MPNVAVKSTSSIQTGLLQPTTWDQKCRILSRITKVLTWPDLTSFDLIWNHSFSSDHILENETKNLDNHWIIKAWNLAHGTSTKIVKSLAEIMTMRKTITPYTISKYIERPFLERLHIFNNFKVSKTDPKNWIFLPKHFSKNF